jgi:hypothetical protein
MSGAGIGKGDVGGGWYELRVAGGSGGDSMLFPVVKAVRLLGVASRITIFMDCLQRAAGQRAQRSNAHSASPGWGLVQ